MMEPIKVMIVDDETLAVEDLVDLLDWESLGFSVIATASNGKRALAKFKQHHPRLVITDIKMPVMDGIELIREIQQLDKSVKFLLLSAYSEFGYAKEAMRLGVKEYIIKNEINEKSFSEKLIQLQKEIAYTKQASSYFTDSYIRNMFNGKKASEDQTARVNEISESVINGKYHSVIVEEDRPLPVLFNRLHFEEPEERFGETETEFNGFQQGGFHVEFSVWLRSGRMVLLLSEKNPIVNYSLHRRMNEFCCGLIRRIQEQTGRSVSAFYFFEKTTLQDAAKDYQNCKDRISIKYLHNPQGVYAFENIPIECILEKQPPDTSVVAQAAHYGDAEKVRYEIQNIFKAVQKTDSYACLAMVSSQLLTILESVQDHDNPVLNQFHGKGGMEPLLCSLDSISSFFQEAFPLVIQSMAARSTYSKEILRAMDYIKRNYACETLSIKDIADAIPFSVTRLSAIFKNEVGKTVLSFITEYRINKAKQMLEEGTYKIYEIADKVGYSSSQYFSQVFTNLVGVNPKEYKSHR